MKLAPSELLSQWVSSARFAVLPLAMIGGIALATATSACGPDGPSSTPATSCIADDDCELGTVCILTSKTCQAVGCEFCITGQICYKADDGTESCSKPECTSNSNCDAMESCVMGACIEATCADKSECPDGQICNQLAGVCQNPPSTCSTDFDCPMGNVCQPDGSCAPGCATDLDCDDVSSYCDPTEKRCLTGCRTDASCEADQSCDMGTRQCICDPSKCAEGSICDDTANACVEKTIESCDDVTCDDGFFCNPANNFQCEPEPEECSTVQGDPNACPPGEVCNQATGNCEVMTCTNGKSQADCDGTSNPVFSMAFCECVQCIDDTNCPTGASCNSNGQCVEGCQACDPNEPMSACPAEASLCFNGCCVECTANIDCQGGDVCLRDGRCGPPPSCTDDPAVCPTGTTCVGGQCQQDNPGGGACDPADAAACPPDQMCLPDPITGMNTCQGGGGMLGECNPACPNGLECTFGFCTGCINDGQCPSGQSCDQPIPLLPGICM